MQYCELTTPNAVFDILGGYPRTWTARWSATKLPDPGNYRFRRFFSQWSYLAYSSEVFRSCMSCLNYLGSVFVGSVVQLSMQDIPLTHGSLMTEIELSMCLVF